MSRSTAYRLAAVLRMRSILEVVPIVVELRDGDPGCCVG